MTVFEWAISLIGYVLAAAWNWFTMLFVSTGALSWWFGVFFTYTVFRLFISPLVGSAGSDTAGKSKKGDDNS